MSAVASEYDEYSRFLFLEKKLKSKIIKFSKDNKFNIFLIFRYKMTTKTNLKRIREILTPNNTDEFDNNISEDDESNSDPDYLSETESDDTSTDECISKEDESSDSNVSNDDIYRYKCST